MKAEADGLETLEERHNPLSRVGEIGSAKIPGRVRGSREKSLAYVQIACDKRSPE